MPTADDLVTFDPLSRATSELDIPGSGQGTPLENLITVTADPNWSSIIFLSSSDKVFFCFFKAIIAPPEQQ